jgi:hypothetical protein
MYGFRVVGSIPAVDTVKVNLPSGSANMKCEIRVEGGTTVLIAIPPSGSPVNACINLPCMVIRSRFSTGVVAGLKVAAILWSAVTFVKVCVVEVPVFTPSTVTLATW